MLWPGPRPRWGRLGKRLQLRQQEDNNAQNCPLFFFPLRTMPTTLSLSQDMWAVGGQVSSPITWPTPGNNLWLSDLCSFFSKDKTKDLSSAFMTFLDLNDHPLITPHWQSQGHITLLCFRVAVKVSSEQILLTSTIFYRPLLHLPDYDCGACVLHADIQGRS